MKTTVQLTLPCNRDGHSVQQLVERCKPLDENSTYCNLLQCDHFAQTSVIAKRDEKTVGFVSGYRIPARPETLFIWQVAVDVSERGTGLATRMLTNLIEREALNNVTHLETTITLDNVASWTLFTRLAERLQTKLEKTEYFKADEHFNGEHDTEWLVRIGPINK